MKFLIQENESLYLEFKYEWYWKNNEKGTVKQWGEFLKDFVALVNCYIDYVDSTKYLIIGIDENETTLEKRIIDTRDFNLDILQEKILNNLNKYFRSEDLDSCDYSNFTLKYYSFESKQILVIEIKPTKSLLILKKDLQDKNRTEKENNVFIRGLKSNNEPEVLNASPEILEELKKKIKNYKTVLEKEEKKEKSIEKTVNLYVQNRQGFSLGNPTKEKNWKENILYEIFPVKSDISNIDFIYIYDKTSQQKTYDHLKEKNLLDKEAQRWILIDNGLNKDLEGIKRKFEAKKIYSLDEFALKHLYGDYLTDSIYHDGNFKKQKQIQNFIEPYTTDIKNQKNALTILSEWFDTPLKPLMVIKGSGGIGKTTLVRYFLDKLFTENKKDNIQSKILFIDSKEIINEISKQGKVNNVYDFYEALAKTKELSKRFNKELLELSIDNGNLLIVLDGIDEVIAKLGNNFDIENFIKTIYSHYSMGNEKSKIIITCRDYFWDSKINTIHNINKLELKAFNLELTKKLFLKEFENNSKAFKKCITYAEEFALSSNSEKEEGIYLPYILDVIMDMVKQQKELGSINKQDITSNLLNLEITNDYFVGRICNREIQKLSNLEIDFQLKFFMNLALNFNGACNGKSIEDLFNDTDIQVTEKLIEIFKGHPLISYQNETLSFRYDFFREYFLNLYISDFFIKKYPEKISDKLKKIINEYIRYDNSFTKYICNRINFNDDFKIFIMELIDIFIKNLKSTENIESRELISSMIILSLVALRESNLKNDIETRTLLLSEILPDNLEYLTLINLFGETSENPIFDFKNQEINNAWFDNYQYFWECNINNTKFYKSTFKHLNPRDGINIAKIDKDLFNDCNTLGIESLLNKNNAENNDKEDKIKIKIIKIFKVFEQGGTFKHQKIDNVRSKTETKILDVLIKNKVITPYINPKKPTMQQYKVSDNYYDFIKILDQSGTSVEMEKILKMFKK